MLTDLTKIDWEDIIKQEAPAVKEDVLKTASERNGHEKAGRPPCILLHDGS